MLKLLFNEYICSCFHECHKGRFVKCLQTVTDPTPLQNPIAEGQGNTSAINGLIPFVRYH